MKTTITIELETEGLIYDMEEAKDKLASALDKVNDENRKKIDEMIEFSLKFNVLVKLAQEQYRGLGKTTQLAKKAKELGAVLFVASEPHVRELNLMGYMNVACLKRENEAYGIKIKNGFLVDEGVKSEVIAGLSRSNNKLLGGFSRL